MSGQTLTLISGVVLLLVFTLVRWKFAHRTKPSNHAAHADTEQQ